MIDVVAYDIGAAPISGGDVSAKHLFGSVEEIRDLLSEGQAVGTFRFLVGHDGFPGPLGVDRVPSFGLVDGCIRHGGSGACCVAPEWTLSSCDG